MTAEIAIWTIVFFAIDIGALIWLSIIALGKDKQKVHED